MTNISIIASGEADNYGVYNYVSSPAMTNVGVIAREGTNNYGVFNYFNSSPAMTNLSIYVYGGMNSYGVYNLSSSSLTMTNADITAMGGTNNYGVYNSNSSPAIMNVRATSRGTGVYNYQASPVIQNSVIIASVYGIYNSTSITNVSRSGIWLQEGTLNIENSIVAHNGVTNNVKVDSGATFTSLGYNLTNSGAGTPFTATTDLINADPLLGPLQDNGGSTWTHALLPSSPAMDRIPFGVNGCGTSVTTDQRGQPRPGTFTHLCDIGAYEAQGVHYEIYLPLVIRQ